MYRYFIELAYKGTAYSGFQVQHNANTIQAEITKALKVISGIDFELTGSSRTDAGVHAKMQCAHFDTDKLTPEGIERYQEFMEFLASKYSKV